MCVNEHAIVCEYVRVVTFLNVNVVMCADVSCIVVRMCERSVVCICG